jgi:uncharacterized membrane protein YecN with MAPEG domain
MNLDAILLIVVAIAPMDTLPPWWLWIIIGILFVFSMVLIAYNLQQENVPSSSKTKQ